MHEHRTRAPTDPLDPDVIAGAILGLLIHDQPCPQTPEELARKLAGFEGDQGQARRDVLDALGGLAAHGLIHQLDGFVFASQSGMRGYALTG